MWVLVELEKELPKQIGPPRNEQPIVIFTDGACEESGTSVGGVLVRPDGSTECFGFVVPEQVTDSWKTKDGQSQVIGQAELFPVLVARWTWQEEIAGKRVIYFVDNESARLALVKCYSPVLPSLHIILDCLEFDQCFSSSPWYARVPTYSNVADDPSRLVVPRALSERGCIVVSPKSSPSYIKRNNFKLGSLRTL